MKKAQFNSDLNFVTMSFSGMPKLPEFQENIGQAIPLLKKYKTSKILNDISELEVNTIENQEWAQDVWFPEAEQGGLKYFAFVKPKDIFGQVSAEQTNEKAEEIGGIKIQYFDDITKAKEWLKANKFRQVYF